MTTRKVISIWYRSITPDGKVWCESSDKDEVVEQSKGKDVHYERMRVLQVEEDWAAFDPRDTISGEETIQRRIKILRYLMSYAPEWISTTQIRKALGIPKNRALTDMRWVFDMAYVERKTDWSTGGYVYRVTGIGVGLIDHQSRSRTP